MVYYAPEFFYLRISQNLEIWKRFLGAHIFSYSVFNVSEIFNNVFTIIFLGYPVSYFHKRTLTCKAMATINSKVASIHREVF